MKLYEDEKVVKILKNILAKDYPYLEYDVLDSKRASNPRGEKRSKNEKDVDVLRVKVNDLESSRDLSVISDIRKKLEKATNINFLAEFAVNVRESEFGTTQLVGTLMESKWPWFSIITQVATYKILGMQTPFFIEKNSFFQGSVAQTVSLRPQRHNLNED